VHGEIRPIRRCHLSDDLEGREPVAVAGIGRWVLACRGPGGCCL